MARIDKKNNLIASNSAASPVTYQAFDFDR